VSWQLMWSDCGGCWLDGELVSSLHCLLLDIGLLSTGLRSLPLLKSVPSLKWEASVYPRCERPLWNRRHGLSGQIILQSWCGCDRSRRSPRVMPPGEGEARDPLST
jgi:hypothetical protein